jgi:hypothetical protein
MEEYCTNGVRLGWLLDPLENCATIYRPGQPSTRIDKSTIITAIPFYLDSNSISGRSSDANKHGVGKPGLKVVRPPTIFYSLAPLEE